MSGSTSVPIDSDALLAALRRATGSSDITFLEAPHFLAKGGEATIDAFRLGNAPPDMEGPLIVRRLHHNTDPQQLVREAAVHRAFEGSSFPVPRVLHLEKDGQVLGQPFLIAERVVGEMLLGEIMQPGTLGDHPARLPGLIREAAFRVPAILADALLRLHNQDPTMLRNSLREFDLPPEDLMFERHLDNLWQRVACGEIAGLKQGADWLRTNRPARSDEVICHGDLLYTNLSMSNGELVGVFDWSNVTLAEPAYDLAASLARLKSHIPDLPVWLAPIVKPLQRRLSGKLVRRYAAQRPLDPARIQYYEAYWILSELASAGSRHLAGARYDGSIETRWLHPATVKAGTMDFERLTGVALTPHLPLV